MYWRIARKKVHKICENGPVLRKLFALPKLEVSQKFRGHVYVDGPQTQLRELEEVKDCGYKLKEA